MRKNLKTITSSLLLLISFALPIIIILYFSKDIRGIEKFIPQTGIAGPITSIILMGVLSATPIPTDPIVIINGAIFGPFTGFLVSWMGNNLAAVIEYFIGIGINKVADFEKQKKKLPFGLNKFSPNSTTFLLLGRFIPQFGGKLVSISSGVYKVEFTKYLWTTALSNLIGSFVLSYGGHKLLHPF